jgi:hypothetical protein
MIIEPGRPGRGDSASRRGRRLRPIAIAPVLALAAAAGLGGCGDRDEPPGMTKQAVAFEDVPAPIREAARKALPAGVNLNEAWKNLDRQGTLKSYEIRGRNPADGKVREVRVSLTGQIEEME